MLRIFLLSLAVALCGAPLAPCAQQEDAPRKKRVRVYPYELQNQTKMSCVEVRFLDHNTGRGWSLHARNGCEQAPFCMIHVDMLINNAIELSALRWAGILPGGLNVILQSAELQAEPQDGNFVKFLSGSYHCQPNASL